MSNNDKTIRAPGADRNRLARAMDDRVFQEKFPREAKDAAGLDEPHVVAIYDFGEIDGRLYVPQDRAHRHVSSDRARSSARH